MAPRLIVAPSTVDGHRKIGAALRRAAKGKANVTLFVAFDDAASAVALLALHERMAGRPVRLLVEPVVKRGIPGDPAAGEKRDYALVDATRLARRAGLELSRTEPLSAAEVEFLAEWAGALPQGPKREAFCIAAMRELWCGSDGPVDRQRFAGIWSEQSGGDPGDIGGGHARRAERRMRRRRLYDTPVAVVHGPWYFAHERMGQIEIRLDELGWVPT